MNQENRWTKPRADGKPHSGEPVECAHCNHTYPFFDYPAILRHCRVAHKEFYRRKWEAEVVPTGQDRNPMFAGYRPID